MPQSNQGLTVGELTIAIAILILASLIWSGIKANNETKKNISDINIETLRQI